MPLIQVKVIENVFTSEQEQEVNRKLSEAMVSIEGENMHSVTSVIIEEIKSGEMGIGGTPLSSQARERNGRQKMTYQFRKANNY